MKITEQKFPMDIGLLPNTLWKHRGWFKQPWLPQLQFKTTPYIGKFLLLKIFAVVS